MWIEIELVNKFEPWTGHGEVRATCALPEDDISDWLTVINTPFVHGHQGVLGSLKSCITYSNVHGCTY